MALVEDGIDAFAFRRTKGTRENLVIRVARPRWAAHVFTAYADGDVLVIGKSDHFIRARFELANPACFDQVKKWLWNYVDPENPCKLALEESDPRLDLGDMLENWIKQTPGFHMFVDKGVVIG